MKKTLAPSILGLENKQEMIVKLIKNGFSWIHYDVMDGDFVENKSLPIDEVLMLFNNTPNHTKDVHLMVKDPDEYLEKLASKADYISFHADAVSFDEMNLLVDKYCNKTKLGIVLNPQTPVSYIEHLLDKLSFVLVMSVVAGKGGQNYMTEVEEKVVQLINKGVIVEMDGGINDQNISHAFDLGAKILVSGSYLLNNFEKENLEKKFKI